MNQLSSKQQERLYYIEFCLLFLGGLRRKDLVNQFQISEPAATKDLALYSELNFEAITYDFREKRYSYTGGKLQFEHDVDRSLFMLTGDQGITKDGDQTVHLPSFVGGSIKRQVPIEIASTITQCMHRKHKIEALYRSLSNGEKIRSLTPMALINDGLRWHVRCFDEENEGFKDYNLARFVSVKAKEKSVATFDDDKEWNQWVELKLETHPKSQYPETIRLDYDINNEKLSKTIPVRACVVGYFLRRWPIDYSDSGTRDPKEFHLFLSNKKELIEAGVSHWAFDYGD